MYASYSRLSKEFKKYHENLSRSNGSWVIDQNNILNVLIHKLKIAWPSKISMKFISSFDDLL